MKTSSTLTRIAVLSLAFGMCGVVTTFAQTPPAAPADAPAGKRGGSGLTQAEQDQYKKAYDQVMAAQPDLKKEADDLKKQMDDQHAQGASVSKDDRKALHAKMHDFEVQKVRPEMLKIDATLGPIFTKMDAARAARRGAAAGDAANKN